jgi:hypothetical protein
MGDPPPMVIGPIFTDRVVLRGMGAIKYLIGSLMSLKFSAVES